MATTVTAPVHRALYEPILLAGAPPGVAILNGTLAAALGLGLHAWLPGLVLWGAGQALAVAAARWDAQVLEVVRRHMRLPARLEA